MYKINYSFFIALMMVTLNVFADDEIFFVSPQPVEMVEKSLKIQIEQNVVMPDSVNVYIQSKIDDDTAPIWSGTLLKSKDFAIDVDTSEFPIGAYEIKVDYFIQNEHYEGDITFWAYKPLPDEGKYF